MSASHLHRGLVSVAAGLVISACGMDLAPGASSSAIAEPRAAPAGAWFCDHTVTGAVDIQPLVGFLEIDRTYLTDRPGFQLMWASLGAYPDGSSFGQVFLLFDDTARAQEFDGWLDQEYDLGGLPFWQRPSLAGGHECFVAEVIDGQGRPSNKASQVVMRTERFPAQGANARQALRDWFPAVRMEAGRRGISSLWLVYSEAQQVASLVYFDDVPMAARDLTVHPPISARPPFVQGTPYDRSGWVYHINFPFEPGDHGEASLWPIPGIHPTQTDGVCEVSRHESFRTTEDCLATCGNGVQDAGEAWFNCPGDVRLY